MHVVIREVLTLEHLKRLGATEAAALLLVRQDMSDDDDDDAVFTAWIEADSANGTAWARACALWERTADAAELQALHGSPAAVTTLAWRVPRYAIAASIAIALVGGTTLLVRRPAVVAPAATQIASAEVPSVVLATAHGEHRSFTLPDGSLATLNTDTSVRVAFRSGGERRIDLLRGQAMFAVFHDRARPFVVAVGGQTVTALGTHFEVRADPGVTRVVLVEGRVAVRTGAAGAAPVILKPGEELTTRGDAAPVVTRADLDAVADWQRGIVTFHDEPLPAAAAELNRYAATRLVVRDPAVSAYRVSGSFHVEDTARFARTVAELYPVRVVSVGNGQLELRVAK